MRVIRRFILYSLHFKSNRLSAALYGLQQLACGVADSDCLASEDRWGYWVHMGTEGGGGGGEEEGGLIKHKIKQSPCLIVLYCSFRRPQLVSSL